MANLILLVEDDPDISDIVVAYLERAGFRAVRAGDGETALQLHRSLRPDLVLLDVHLPKLDGWQVLTQLRQRDQTPVIMLTAMDQDLDKLFALRAGADDYVIKPFNPAEVVARVQAVLRRTLSGGGSGPAALLRAGPLEIDTETHSVKVNQERGTTELSLTLTEFRILAHMARAPRRIHTRAELLAVCLPEGEALERTVDSHVSKLRKKLEEVGLMGTPASVRGVGYRLSGTSP